ncbi:MAG: SDR family oxidoreductase [Pseudomonadota bacterium]
MTLDEMFSMRGKICLITGGSRGLGYFMARAFFAAGATRVYITARKADACRAAAEALSAFGDCVALPGDLSNMDDITALADTLKSREPRLDVLVNNAGCAWLEPFETFPEKGWDKVMNLNVKTPFFLTRELVPLLAAEKSAEDTASVINIGSIAGICGATDTLSYAPSKSAIHHVTRNLSALLANQHIRVNAIAPGRFFTTMTEYASQDQTQYENEIAYIPLHRWGEEKDIGGVAVLLASTAGGFITGEILTVDGGTSVVR